MMSYGDQSGPESTSPFPTLPGPQPSRSTSTFAMSDRSDFLSGDQGINAGNSRSSDPPAEDGRLTLLKLRNQSSPSEMAKSQK